MKSDFAAARVHLDRAYHYLQGRDPASEQARVVLVDLLEVVTAGEWRQPEPASKAIELSLPKRAGVAP